MPVFNFANTLKAAVRSIQNQKLLDIEIILVNGWDIFDIAFNAAEEENFDVIAFNSFQSINIDMKGIYKDVFTNNKKENPTLYQPELSCFCVSNNGTKEAVNDLYIWGK